MPDMDHQDQATGQWVHVAQWMDTDHQWVHVAQWMDTGQWAQDVLMDHLWMDLGVVLPPPYIPPPGMVPQVDNTGFPPAWQSEPASVTATPSTETTAVPDVWGLCRGSEIPQPTPPPKVEKKTKDSKKEKKASGKKTFNDKPPPPGRSQGVISFIGPTYGFIERDDLQKFSFTFDAFLGVQQNMIPGVRVHFTAYKEKAGLCATDVAVPPGGTEEIDSTVLEGFVISAIPVKLLGEKQKHGQVEANIDGKTIALLYTDKDCTITLLKGDHVTLNLLTDLVSQYTRATNIRPKIPNTFQVTGEKREVGVVMSIKGSSGIIMTENKNSLPFETAENMSRTELTVLDEVDFTVVTIKKKEKIIRVRKLNEVIVEEPKEKVEDSVKDKWKPMGSVEDDAAQKTGVLDEISTAQHEGKVIKAVLKISDKKQEKGLLEALVAGTEKQLTFSADDILTEATMFDGDMVRFNISTNSNTKEERAVNVEILMETFEESTEQRRTGVVVQAGELSGTIKCHQSPQLLFYRLTEVLENKKLVISEKVEFSVIPLEAAEDGNQAIRIKRLIESIFTPVPKLGGMVAKETKKMTIKLMTDPKDLIKAVKVENTDDEPINDKPASEESDKMKAVVKTLRSKPSGPGSGGKDSDTSRRKYGRSDRSPSLDQFGRIKKRLSTSREPAGRSRNKRSHSRSRSRSRERSRRQRSRSGSRRRSHSLERKDPKHRRSSSLERTLSKRSRSRERGGSSQRSSKKGSGKPPDNMNDVLERKKRELEALNELIYRKRAMVAREKHVPNFMPMEKTCFDYNHGMPELPPQLTPPIEMKPKSILKKRAEHVTGPLFPIQTQAQPLDQRLVEQYGYEVDAPYKRHFVEPKDIQTVSQKSNSEGSPARNLTPDISAKYDPYERTSPIRETPLDPYSSYQPATSRESQGKNPHMNAQLTRFLNILNKGVDAGVLSTLVKETREESFSKEDESSFPEKRFCEFHEEKDQYRDSFGGRVEEHRSFIGGQSMASDISENVRNEDLLPHERAIQDGGGFSGILGMTTHSQFLRKPERIDEEEDFLYGGGQAADAKMEPYKKPCWSHPARDEWRASPAGAPVEEPREQESQNKTQHFDKIKSLLQAIGLNLNTSEVTKLADRTQERLYGTKSSRQSSYSSERETKHSSKQGDRHQNRATDSSDSDRLGSASPYGSSQREVYLSPHDSSDYGGFLDPEEEAALEKARQMQTLTKTVSASPPSPTPSTPSSSIPITTWIRPQKSQPLNPKGWPSTGSMSSYLSSLPPSLPSPLSPSSTNLPHFSTGQQGAASAATDIPVAMFPLAQQVNISNQVTVSNPTRDVLNQILQATSQSRCLKVIETVKSVSNAQQASPRPRQVQTHSPETTAALPSPPLQSPESNSPTGTEDDIKAKQKKRLEQFNLRMRQKNQQKMNEDRERKFRKKSTGKVPKVTFANMEPRNVWICGHSLIYWAEMRAKSPEIGMQLGMDPSSVRVWWKGTQGMTWAQLLPQLDQLKMKWPNPDVVILHLGGNDLGANSPEAFLVSVKKDLTSMRSIFPECLLVWSNILPRTSWRHTNNSEEVDKVRAAINRRIQSTIAELGGTALTHENITCGSGAGLYRPDGIHLSGKGIDTFNLNLQDFLEKWESEAVTEMS
ncbi:hypothetical protein DPEC_G00038610 [Dallia pectoralis]|uniref:Uncharacterized protein n=1 Tax=Dallia pectoralis TaxID=75939 RepID=A0ACC2HE52_DALPE|nr:hypothetical protein DPEC_G00038610 [Dallia pectoralis]